MSDAERCSVERCYIMVIFHHDYLRTVFVLSTLAMLRMLYIYLNKIINADIFVAGYIRYLTLNFS